MYQTMDRFHHKQKFTKKEDEQLLKLVKKHGVSNWEEVSRRMQRRTARQCRDRYNNYLCENFKKGEWTEEEDKLIISLYHKIGPRWLIISKSLPKRSGNDVKNRWHKILLKKINNINDEKIDTQKKDTENENDKKDDIKNDTKNNDKSGNGDNRDVNNILDNIFSNIDNQWNLFPNEDEKSHRFDIY